MPTPVFVEPDTQRVNFCCCFNRGSMSLGTTVDDTSVGRGGALGVGLACKNDSTSEIVGVEVVVTERVVWGSLGGGRKNHRSRELARVEIDAAQVMGAAQLDPEALKQMRASGVNRHIANFQALFQQLSLAGGVRAQISLPADARDTYCGSVIRTTTTMSVTMRTAMCITNPVHYAAISTTA